MMIEQLLTSPEQITFATLFIGLLVYVMKTNDTREKNYRHTIEKLTLALEKVNVIDEKLDNVLKSDKGL